MQTAHLETESGVLSWARIVIVAEASRAILAIEDGLRAVGAAVLRTAPADVPWWRYDRNDVVIVQLSSPTHTDIEHLQSLASRQPVVALLDAPPKPSMRGLGDFVLRPFRAAEVVARVELVLDEVRSKGELRAGNLVLHIDTRSVSIGDEAVDLTFYEFEILRALLSAEGAVLSREVLERHLGHEIDTAGRAVDLHIHRLRNKIRGLEGAQLETVRSVGYRITRF